MNEKLDEIKSPFESIESFEAWGRAMARHGAKEALREIGLGDERAAQDVHEIREWLDGIRGFKRIFKETTAKAFSLAFWVLILAGTVSWLKGQFHE